MALFYGMLNSYELVDMCDGLEGAQSNAAGAGWKTETSLRKRQSHGSSITGA